MYAYVFGRHNGQPPTNLVGTTFRGVTVQSMTALEGPAHTLFTKLHLTDASALSRPMSGEDPLGEVVDDAEVMIGCESVDCSGLVGNIVSRISFIGADHVYFCFILCDIDGPLTHLPAHEQEVGPDRIAAATDGKGRALIELAGDDQDELLARAARITDHPAIRMAGIYLSRDLVRAAQ
jgi:hypothetical protein